MRDLRHAPDIHCTLAAGHPDAAVLCVFRCVNKSCVTGEASALAVATAWSNLQDSLHGGVSCIEIGRAHDGPSRRDLGV